MKNCQLRITNATRTLPSKGQRGFVLVIALIVLAAMTLAAAAMVRTIDTSTMLARNISFKRDALNRGDVALEAAINQFRTGGNLSDTGLDKTINQAVANYFAVMMPTDTDGVPMLLKGSNSLNEVDVTAIPNSYDLGMHEFFMIERMCTATGPALAETCIVNGRIESGGTQPNDKPGQLFPPLYRITARVTGPRNTVSYVQAIFSLTST